MHVVGWQRRWPRCITHFVMFFFVFKSHMMDFLPDWQTFHRNSCRGTWKCYAMDCFGAYFVHVQTYGLLRSVQHMSKQSATQWPASVHFTHVQTCHNVRVKSATQWRLWHNFTHVQTCHNVRLQKVLRNGLGTYFTHVQARDKFRVQSATPWTASVHTLHMAKPVITSLVKVLLNRLLRCILYTCPNLW